MEFPPSSYDIFPAEQFETAAVRSPGELGMELLVQVRDTGRIQDHFRIILGGNKLLTARLAMRDVFRVTDFPDWTVLYTKWPADINFNRNWTTTTWECLNTLIKSKDVRVVDPMDRSVDYEDVLAALDDQRTSWAAGIGDGQRMMLTMQSLPMAAELLVGKPLTKG